MTTASLGPDPDRDRWAALLAALMAGTDLSGADSRWVMDQVMRGDASPVRLGAFLVALRSKGETVEELTGLADGMLAHARRIEVPGRTVDIVGTGGDMHRTVNISTMASLVVAGAGVRVVKHGGRAASSASGTADVLEALGLRLDLEPERVAALAEEVGITFCFAQVFHPAMRHAAPTRRELGVPTAFNVLGPLTNPARPTGSALGVPDARLAGLMAGVLAERGSSALVFRGHEGLDEMAPNGPVRVWWVRDGAVEEHTVDPVGDLGMDPVGLDELRGGGPEENAGVVRALVAGDDGPVRRTVLLNAAAGIVADGSLPGTGEGSLVDRLSAGLEHATRSVDSGAARDVLERWIAAARA